jgi:hypothetical protein
MRDWINAKQSLVGVGNPLSGGAYLKAQRSPASGCYAVITRDPSPSRTLVAEGEGPSLYRISAQVFGGTTDLAEQAATALGNMWQTLNGNPEPLGKGGALVYVSDNPTGPSYVGQPPDAGELYCFTVASDFVIG